MRYLFGLLLLLGTIVASGCGVGDWGGLPRATIQSYWDHKLDEDPDSPAPSEREDRNEAWKQHWQTQPGVNPAMTEAYGHPGE